MAAFFLFFLGIEREEEKEKRLFPKLFFAFVIKIVIFASENCVNTQKLLLRIIYYLKHTGRSLTQIAQISRIFAHCLTRAASGMKEYYQHEFKLISLF